MKITKEQLKQMIKEELDTVIGESYYDNEMQRHYDAQIQKRIEKDKAEKQKSDEEEAGEDIEESIMVKEGMSDEEWVQLLKDIREFAEGEANMVAHEPMGHFMVAEKIMDKYRDQLMKVVNEEKMEDIAYSIAWQAAKGYDEY